MRIVYRGSQRVYLHNGRELTEDEFNNRWKTKPPDYEKGEFPRVQGDLGDWSNENRGRGRYIPQLAEHHNDPKAFYTSVSAVEHEAKRRGKDVQRM